MDDLSHPAIKRVVRAAERKGVSLGIVFVRASSGTIEEIAAIIGADPGQIVRSVVYVAPRPDGRAVPIVCLVSGRNHVDAGKLAAVVGEPVVRRVGPREARALTGFSAAAVPPIGFDHGVAVVMDSDLGRYPLVWAPAGTSAAVFAVPPVTLRALANALVALIAEEPWHRPAVAPTLGSQLQAG
jgi:prolyl-tRNA editing enzyme YbaK/EbsC (Cys-tRNA(Pro) deacylase)